MDSNTLREQQAPIKDRYRADPDAAVFTLRAVGTLGSEQLTCKVSTGRGLIEAGLHPATGGDGLALCSGDLLLEALVACAGVTLQAVASALDIVIKNGRIVAEGELDFRGTLAISKDVPVGFRAVSLRFELETEATEEQLATLLKLTERYCVIYQTIRTAPALITTLIRTAQTDSSG